MHLQEGSWRSVLAESLNRCGVFFCILTGRSNRTWVRRELSCAIRLSVVYGSPLIRVVEADHTLEELDLDQAARESITLEGLQRRPAVGLVPWLEKTMVGLRLAVLLILMSCPFF